MGNTLHSLGVSFNMYEDGMDINGFDEQSDFTTLVNPIIDSFGDHRIAMSSAIACSLLDQNSLILNTDNVNTSFPTFLKTSNQVGLDITLEENL